MVMQAVQFRVLQLHLERLGDIVQAEPECDENEASVSITAEGRLVLRNATFRYGPETATFWQA